MKLFLSHSSQDIKIVKQFTDLLLRIGIPRKNIICTSVPELNIPLGNDIYEYLRTTLDSEDVYVIFLLSNNYYTSPTCLNEMGAVWIRQSKSINILLPNFGFDDIKGVAKKNNISIKLGTKDFMVKSLFNNFFEQMKQEFNINVSELQWEEYRDIFLESSVNLSNDSTINMLHVDSFCIGDLEREGCKIIKRQSSINSTTAMIDFSKTDSKLCSIVYFLDGVNWENNLLQNKSLCFEAYADETITKLEIEIHFKNSHNIRKTVALTEDMDEYRLPLKLFTTESSIWKETMQLCFLFYKSKVSGAGLVTIQNLRLE